MIQIIDYGMGNLRSVQKACEKLGHSAEICTHPHEISDSAKLILPGVGAFRDAIEQLRQHDLVDAIRDHIGAGRPFLGICLGLHLLFDVSYEDGEYEGLGIIPGQVVRFESRPGLRIPHMGWNALQIEQASPLLHGLHDGDHVYFVHSYHVVPQEDAVVATRTDHGGPFVSMIARDNLFATQFHPEKSQRIGLKLLENFANLPV